MLHSHSQASLSIHVSSATELVSAQTFGKQDPFLQFALNFEEKDNFLKTFTHKNAGENATWNQTFTISLNGEPDLFVEVLDEESTVDEVIGFAAIPINQVVHADGANLNGLFEIYNTKGERAGLLNLQLAAIGFPNSRTPDFNGEPVRGQSYVHDGHCARMKSSKKKATGVSVGGALLGGAFAVGAGILGKKLYDDRQEQEQEQEQERLQNEAESQRLKEEEENNRRGEDEKRQHEREEFDQERARYQQEKEEFEREKANRHNNNDDEERNNNRHEERNKHHDEDRNEHHGGHRRRNSDSSDDNDAKKWNPVGTYAPGDRVKYHGNVYMCLQGHTSNPTWQPGAAHSLWQAE